MHKALENIAYHLGLGFTVLAIELNGLISIGGETSANWYNTNKIWLTKAADGSMQLHTADKDPDAPRKGRISQGQYMHEQLYIISYTDPENWPAYLKTAYHNGQELNLNDELTEIPIDLNAEAMKEKISSHVAQNRISRFAAIGSKPEATSITDEKTSSNSEPKPRKDKKTASKPEPKPVKDEETSFKPEPKRIKIVDQQFENKIKAANNLAEKYAKEIKAREKSIFRFLFVEQIFTKKAKLAAVLDMSNAKDKNDLIAKAEKYQGDKLVMKSLFTTRFRDYLNSVLPKKSLEKKRK
jgi:hypothetical protein